MRNTALSILSAAALIATDSYGQSLHDPFPDASDPTPVQWVPQSLKQSHNVTLENYVETEGDLEIAITPKTSGAHFSLRLVTGPSRQVMSSMIDFAKSSADEIGDEAAAEIFDLAFSDGVPCLGSKEDTQIICAFDGFALEFSSEDASYETLREHADRMQPLRNLAEAAN